MGLDNEVREIDWFQEFMGDYMRQYGDKIQATTRATAHKRGFDQGREYERKQNTRKLELETLISGHMEAMRPLLKEWKAFND